MDAAVISIGDELTLGQTIDSNSAYISAKLAELGIIAVEQRTLSDDKKAISRAIEQLAASVDVLIITGGLGPTEDDLTRQALADAMGTRLQTDKSSLNQIEQYFKQRGRVVSKANKTQALVPVGATATQNQHGTAPGIEAAVKNALVFAAPGVPREMRKMLETSILARLK